MSTQVGTQRQVGLIFWLLPIELPFALIGEGTYLVMEEGTPLSPFLPPLFPISPGLGRSVDMRA